MYVLDPEPLGEIASEVAGRPHEEMFTELVSRLRARYADHIAAEPRWLFNLNGGATGAMAMLHASLSEYLVVFGTPLGTEGFSGRYTVDIHDWVLSGELWNLRLEDPFERRVFRAGDEATLPRGEARGFRLSQDGWLLEYGRGNVPTTLPRALGDAMFRAQDPTTILETLRAFGSLAAHELFRSDED